MGDRRISPMSFGRAVLAFKNKFLGWFHGKQSERGAGRRVFARSCAEQTAEKKVQNCPATFL
jgi:hypothetical protein